VPNDFTAENLHHAANSAAAALADGRCDVLESLCYAALATSPREVDWLLKLSQACDRLRLWAAAETTAVEATRVQPTHAFAQYRVGWVRVQRNNPVDAVEPLEAAIKALPGSGRYQSMLAYALGEAALQPERARSLCESSVTLSPTDVWTWHNAALTWVVLGDGARAEACTRRATTFDPDGYSHVFVLAAALRLQGMLELALETADKAVAQWPEGSGALAERSESLRLLGRFDEALESGRLAAKVAPESWEAQWAFVQALASSGAHAEATRVAESVAARSPHPRMRAIPLALRGSGEVTPAPACFPRRAE
jgi:tetratricopeptide (TPR) repeat protein